MKKNLKEQLDKLWATTINSYEFDILSNSITFEIESLWSGKVEHYTVRFLKVNTWYFVKGCAEFRKEINDPEPWECLEISTIDIVDNVKMVIDDELNILERYNSEVNVCIEIWSSLLLIEAEAIEVDGVTYPLPCKK